MTYKYNGIAHPPEQVGIYTEETVTLVAGSNTIGTRYDIATNLCVEQWIHDPDNNAEYNQGVVKLYNNDDTTNIFDYIDTVSGSTITTTDYGGGGETISAGEEVVIGYYAVGTDNGASDQFTDPSKSAGLSDEASPGFFESYFNIMNVKSSKKMIEHGYVWADVLARKEISGLYINEVAVQSEFRFDTSGSENTDYQVNYDDSYPFFINEIRFIVDNTGLYVEPYIKTQNRTTDDYFGEGGNNYIDIANSSCTYRSDNAGSVYICSIPVGSVAATSVEVGMQRDTMGTSDTVVVELSGMYKPIMGEADGGI